MKKKILLFCACFYLLAQANGQRIIQPKLVELDLKGVIYKKEWSLDFKLHEQGYAIAFNTAEVLSYDKTKFYQIELGTIKDPRERRQNKTFSLPTTAGSRSFIFGKINQFVNVRASLGFKKYLSEKAKRKGLAVGYSYAFGPVVGILKPYYLNLIYRPAEIDSTEPEFRDEAYSPENAEKFLTFNDINGAASPWRGFSEAKIIPGIQGKIAGHFALGAFDKYVKAAEIGLMADLYIRKVDIVVESDGFSNKSYFVKLFANLQLGMRKN